MRLPNRAGDPVDPVPFLVVAGLGFAVCYAFGPLYLMALGLALPVALSVATGVFLLVVAAAFNRYVWSARPDLRREVPADVRFRRLVHGVVIAFATLVLLALPLVAR